MMHTKPGQLVVSCDEHKLMLFNANVTEQAGSMSSDDVGLVICTGVDDYDEMFYALWSNGATGWQHMSAVTLPRWLRQKKASST